MKSKALLAAAAALAMVGAAQAGTVTFSFSNPFETTEINQSTGTLGLFDSTLGTLTGVSLTFSGANVTSGTLTNNAANANTVTAISETELYFNSSLAALQAMITAANPVLQLSATSNSISLDVGQSAAYGPLSDSDTISWDLNSILSTFSQAGGGDFGLGCKSISEVRVRGGGGNVASNQHTEAQCGASITYTYDDAPTNNVPEPAMPALVGLSLLGLWAVRRRQS